MIHILVILNYFRGSNTMSQSRNLSFLSSRFFFAIPYPPAWRHLWMVPYLELLSASRPLSCLVTLFLSSPRLSTPDYQPPSLVSASSFSRRVEFWRPCRRQYGIWPLCNTNELEISSHRLADLSGDASLSTRMSCTGWHIRTVKPPVDLIMTAPAAGGSLL